jgi:hypothetical protein
LKKPDDTFELLIVLQDPQTGEPQHGYYVASDQDPFATVSFPLLITLRYITNCDFKVYDPRSQGGFRAMESGRMAETQSRYVHIVTTSAVILVTNIDKVITTQHSLTYGSSMTHQYRQNHGPTSGWGVGASYSTSLPLSAMPCGCRTSNN